MFRILSRFSLNTQLSLFNGILVFFILIIGTVSQLTINSSNRTLEKVVSSESSLWINQAVVTKSDLMAQLWLAYSLYAENTPVTGGPINDVNGSLKSLEQSLDKYVAVTTFSSEDDARYKKIQTNRLLINSNVQKVLDELQGGKINRDEIKKQISSISDSCLDVNDFLTEILSETRKNTINIHLSAKAKETRVLIGLIIILVIAVILILAGVVTFVVLKN